MRHGKVGLAVATIMMATAALATTAMIAANAGTTTGATPPIPSPIPGATPSPADTMSVAAPASTSPADPSPTQTYDPATKPCRPTASACVDIAAGKAWLQVGGHVIRGPVPINTGTPAHPTPTGTFHVAWKAEYTRSTIYDIPMPYSVFFAAGGIAFHEGPLTEHSHGCVHLDHDDAQAFFAALKVGDEVDVW